jgi:hypothetical protein
MIAEGPEDLLDPRALGIRQAPRPDRVDDLLDRRVANLVPGGKALA